MVLDRHACGLRQADPLTIGSSELGGGIFGEPREWVDVLDKSASLDIDTAPRRSTSSLDETMTSTSDLTWEVVATLPDVASAHVLATMIRGEGVPAMVITDSSLLGEARRSDVRVPQELARRARWLMSQAKFTDAELTFLATGELGGDDNAEQ